MKSRLPHIISLGLLLIVTCLVLKYKLMVLFSHGYTSDMFSFDQGMQESFRGNLSLEYFYGRFLGDHAYWFLILLLPLKALLGKHMVMLLILLGPASFVGSALLLWRALKNSAGAAEASLCTIPYLLTVNILMGLGEPTFGFHPDTLSGFLAVGFTAALVERQRQIDSGQASKKVTGLFIALLIVFMSLKEEMTLLAVVYFAVLMLFERSRWQINALHSAWVVLVAQFVSIRLLETPWNRTNALLLHNLFSQAQAHGVLSLIWGPTTRQYWSIVSVSLLLTGLPFLLARARNRFALALAVIGLVKLGLGLIVIRDAVTSTWHNFPGLVMLSGACALQLHALFQPPVAEARRPLAGASNWRALVALSAVIGISCWRTAVTDMPKAESMIRQTFRTSPANRTELEARALALAQIKKDMDPAKVVALNGYTSIDWCDGYRYAFFPRGVTDYPVAIADYIIADKLFADAHMSDYLSGPTGRQEFEPRAKNAFFVLWQRKAVAPEHLEERQKFVRYFGSKAIGGDHLQAQAAD